MSLTPSEEDIGELADFTGEYRLVVEKTLNPVHQIVDIHRGREFCGSFVRDAVFP